MPTSMLRLKKRADFLRIAALRRKWAAPGLILQVAPQPETDGSRCQEPMADALRVGFTVSKKVGNAVARNRAKRRLRAAVDEIFPKHARSGHDYVVIGRQETVERPYSLLLQDLQTALKRVGALRSGTASPPSGDGPARPRTEKRDRADKP
jgi:ribonuclease P protein component